MIVGMTLLKSEYKSFLDDIEKNIKNKQDLEYIKGRFAVFVDAVIEQMENIMNYKEEKLNQLEDKQKEIDKKMEKMQQIINHIEEDIYAEDGFDFEIVCPYCNYEFIIDLDENRTEIECPECKNIIELDWSGNVDNEGQTGCSGHCGGCSGCSSDEDEDM